jgi:NAD(P)-dependent dehydrogenase (short-subunit alcohol dehydrogenase family)
MQRLAGKRIVVTGGTTGIGYASAERFVAEGATVLLTGQSAERVAQAATALGEQATGLVVDQSNLDSVHALAEAVRARFGALDVLFLNAGVAVPAATDAETESGFDRQFTINVKAPFFIMQALAPALASGASVIVNTTTLTSLGMPGMATYSASKAALRSLVRTWAAEYVGRGVRVNAIAPGPVETPIYAKLGLDEAGMQAWATQILGNVPMKRFASADEIAGAAAFLASADSAYMTGEELTLDGGWASV